jgi:hypothetical protein
MKTAMGLGLMLGSKLAKRSLSELDIAQQGIRKDTTRSAKGCHSIGSLQELPQLTSNRATKVPRLGLTVTRPSSASVRMACWIVFGDRPV